MCWIAGIDATLRYFLELRPADPVDRRGDKSGDPGVIEFRNQACCLREVVVAQSDRGGGSLHSGDGGTVAAVSAAVDVIVVN